MDNSITIKYDDLKQIIDISFERGVRWSDTYKGWFVPTEEQMQNEVNNTYDNILEALQIINYRRLK